MSMYKSGFLSYRAYKTIQMPEGILPAVVQANEVFSIHVEDLKRSPELQDLIASGALRSESAVLAPLLTGQETRDLPTAGEIIEALQQHPDIYNEIKQYFQVILAAERAAEGFVGDPETKYATSGIALDMLMRYGEADAKLALSLSDRGIITSGTALDLAPEQKKRLGEAMSSELQKVREAARKDQFVNGGPFRVMAELAKINED